MKTIFRNLEEYLCVGLLTSIVILASIQVISRYIFNNPLDWTEELSRFLMIWLVFFGASAGIKSKMHVNITLFIDKLSDKWKKAVNYISLLLVIGLLIVIIYHGARLTIQMAYTPAITLPITWAYVYSAIPIGFLFILIRVIQYRTF